MVGTQFEFNFDPVRSAQARDEAMVRVDRGSAEGEARGRHDSAQGSWPADEPFLEIGEDDLGPA